MNVVAYCRVSTDGQAQDDKFGIDSQKSLIQNYAAQHDMTITKWYIDEGASGIKESRPAMDELLFNDTVSNPPIEAVLVAKSDRIARDIKLYFYYMMLLEKRKIHLISATEQVVNDDTGLGNVYKSLMLFVAQQERKNIMKRTTGGRNIKAKTGGYSGGRPPFGYKASDHTLVIIPEQAAVVRRIFKLKQEGVPYRDMIEVLYSEGYKTRYGGKFATSTISSVIANEKLYRGYYKYGTATDGWIAGDHEAIL